MRRDQAERLLDAYTRAVEEFRKGAPYVGFDDAVGIMKELLLDAIAPNEPVVYSWDGGAV